MSETKYQDLRTRALNAFWVSNKAHTQKRAKEFSKTFDVPLERIEVRENGLYKVDGLMFRRDGSDKTYRLVVECAKCGRLHNYSGHSFSDLAGMGKALENLGEGPFRCGAGLCQESDA